MPLLFGGFDLSFEVVHAIAVKGNTRTIIHCRPQIVFAQYFFDAFWFILVRILKDLDACQINVFGHDLLVRNLWLQLLFLLTAFRYHH